MVGTISQWQGCPSWGGIWWESEAKSWSEGYELHIRLTKVGRVYITKQSPILHETLGVNVVDIWDEGCCSHLGRSENLKNHSIQDHGTVCMVVWEEAKLSNYLASTQL